MRFTGKYIHILLSMSVMLQLYPCGPRASTVAPAAAIAESFFERSASAAGYNESTHTWTLFAKILQVKDVSIYGRPGSIAQIAYMNKGRPQRAWAAVRMDDYFFSDRNFPLAEDSEIILQVSGSYVSSEGVDWTACPGADSYCQNASFIEGGFPVSEDFGGLAMSPSNMLIHRGNVANGDWVNGILAWKIRRNASRPQDGFITSEDGPGSRCRTVQYRKRNAL
jgi:hypothetical protein